MEYCKLGLDVSATGGEALKLIFAASFNEGLKVDVIFTCFFPGLSCAEATSPPSNKPDSARESFIILESIDSFIGLVIGRLLCCSCFLRLLLSQASTVLPILILHSDYCRQHSGK